MQSHKKGNLMSKITISTDIDFKSLISLARVHCTVDLNCRLAQTVWPALARWRVWWGILQLSAVCSPGSAALGAAILLASVWLPFPLPVSLSISGPAVAVFVSLPLTLFLPLAVASLPLSLPLFLPLPPFFLELQPFPLPLVLFLLEFLRSKAHTSSVDSKGTKASICDQFANVLFQILMTVAPLHAPISAKLASRGLKTQEDPHVHP